MSVYIHHPIDNLLMLFSEFLMKPYEHRRIHIGASCDKAPLKSESGRLASVKSARSNRGEERHLRLFWKLVRETSLLARLPGAPSAVIFRYQLPLFSP